MSVWDKIAGVLSDVFGISVGVIGHATLVVGMFFVFMMGVFGAILLTMGAFAIKSGTLPKWLGTFAVGASAIMLLLWVMIPGWVLMNTLGLVAGIVGKVAAILMYRKGIEAKTGAYVCLIIGIVEVGLALLVVMVELFAGGGFLV